MSWPLVAIKDVAKVITGKTPSKLEDDNFGGEIPFVTPTELNGSVYVSDSPQTITEKGAYKLKLTPKDAVMVCCIGSLGKLAIAAREVATNQQINSVIFDKDKVYPKYGYHCLSRLKPIMEALAPSTTIAIINKSNFESLQIPLPPIAEQKRISNILDKANDIYRKRQQAIQLADEFICSVFLKMFGDPVRNPNGWNIDYLPNLGTFKNGLNYGKDDVGTNIPCLGVGDFKSLDRIEGVDTLSNIQLNALPAKDYFLQDGDLVFVRSNGNKALVGRCIAVYPGKAQLTFSGFCIRFRISSKEINTDYLNYMFRIPSVKHEMLKGGQGANIQNINQKKLSEIAIPIPSKSLQSKFSEIVKAFKLTDLKRCVNSVEITNLLGAVSQKAFTGKI